MEIYNKKETELIKKDTGLRKQMELNCATDYIDRNTHFFNLKYSPINIYALGHGLFDVIQVQDKIF